MKEVKAALYGVGAIGSLVAKCLLEKKGIELVSAIDVAKDKVGKDLGEVLNLGREIGIRISNDLNAEFSRTKPDIAIHATSSFLRDAYAQIASIVNLGVSVISTCEELSYPYPTHPKLAEQLDHLAKSHDATILGTGINPGFLMDTLVITLTAPCQKIEKIQATRVMNAATRRLPFQMKIGAGLTVEDFNRKIEDRQISGHVGLEQSIAMIAGALAWKLDKVTIEQPEPVIASRPIESRGIRIKAGNTAGLKQKARGIVKKKEAITLDFQAYIGAEDEHDSIEITGVPNIKQRIQPCVHGDIGTVAMVINSIPKVIKAPSGLLTMKDLPIPSAALENMTKYLI